MRPGIDACLTQVNGLVRPRVAWEFDGDTQHHPDSARKGATDETDIPCQASHWLSSTGRDSSVRFPRVHMQPASEKIGFLTRSKSVFILHVRWTRRETPVIEIESRIAS